MSWSASLCKTVVCFMFLLLCVSFLFFFFLLTCSPNLTFVDHSSFVLFFLFLLQCPAVLAIFIIVHHVLCMQTRCRHSLRLACSTVLIVVVLIIIFVRVSFLQRIVICESFKSRSQDLQQLSDILLREKTLGSLPCHLCLLQMSPLPIIMQRGIMFWQAEVKTVLPPLVLWLVRLMETN